MIEVTDDLYLLRFIYDKYGYSFITFSDLVRDIKWLSLRVLRAVHSLESWGFIGDQRYGVMRDDPQRIGSGYCLDSKYAIELMFNNEVPKLADMIPCKTKSSLTVGNEGGAEK